MLEVLKSPWDDGVHPLILMIEDSDEDFYAFLRAAKQLAIYQSSPPSYRLLRFQNGDEALDYLLREGEFRALTSSLPALVLLDLNLPGTDGREIIQRVKRGPEAELNKLPIVVLTTSSSPHDIQACYHFGASSYLLKPMGVAQMQQMVQTLFQYWFQLVVLP